MRPREDLFICGDVAAKLTRDMDRRTHAGYGNAGSQTNPK
jgi:hypothetical protein